MIIICLQISTSTGSIITLNAAAHLPIITRCPIIIMIYDHDILWYMMIHDYFNDDIWWLWWLGQYLNSLANLIYICFIWWVQGQLLYETLSNGYEDQLFVNFTQLHIYIYIIHMYYTYILYTYIIHIHIYICSSTAGGIGSVMAALGALKLGALTLLHADSLDTKTRSW